MTEIFGVLFAILCVIFGALFAIVFGLVWLWGLADMYGCYRFARRPEYDKTASVLHWWEVKSLFATQSKAMIKKFPWLGMDLSEDRELTDEDGKIT